MEWPPPTLKILPLTVVLREETEKDADDDVYDPLF